MPLPKMFLVRQNFPDRQIANIPSVVEQQMNASPFAESFQPGASIAIGVGSRGISNLPIIVNSVVDYWKGKGLEPFIFPAMGSHGGATAEGQEGVLANLGITESAMNCRIVSSLDVVSMGRTPDGIDTIMDKKAYESAGVFLINRVKWHTDFSGTIESGLFKMMAIGMGKWVGAQHYHKRAYRGDGLEKVIRSVGRQMLASGKIIGGLAIAEDANNNTARIEALPSQGLEQREEKLLALVKSWKGDIPVPEVDILIVNEIGKIFSGPGMDPKVVNRSSTTGAYNPLKNTPTPWIGRIYVRALNPPGNAMGIGMTDVIHDDVLAAMDRRVTEINAETAQIPAAIRIPMMHYPTDRECLGKIAGLTDSDNPRVAWIQNSRILNVLGLSENLEQQIRGNPNLEIIGEAEPFTFDANGQLSMQLFTRAAIISGSKTAPLRLK